MLNFSRPLLSLHTKTHLAGQLARGTEQSSPDDAQNSALFGIWVASSSLFCPPRFVFIFWFHSPPIAQYAMLSIVD